jgi:hypothetical protein
MERLSSVEIKKSTTFLSSEQSAICSKTPTVGPGAKTLILEIRFDFTLPFQNHMVVEHMRLQDPAEKLDFSPAPF